MVSSSNPVLYGNINNPPVRTIVAVSRILGFEIELKDVDFSKQEHLSPEFLKINSFHCVPTLVDSEGFSVWESRAIATYLIETRSKGSTLYPIDLKKRATIDKFLYYDTGKLVPTLNALFYAGLQGEDPAAKLTQVKDMLKTLDDFLAQNGTGFIAGGNDLSLADISIHFTLLYLDILTDFIDAKQYSAIVTYSDKVKQALAPYQTDGLFDEAQESFLKMVEAFKAQTLAQK